MHATPHPATPNLVPNLTPGLGVLLRNLAALIARRFLHHPLHAALTIPLWQHFTRAALRLDRLLARLAAGKLPPPRPRANNRSGPHHRSKFPTTSGWLIRALGAEAAIYAAQIEALLADPEAADLLACTAVRRTLAPIRRMLGIAPARPRRPVAAASVPPHEAPPRPAPIPPHPIPRPAAQAPAPPLVAPAAPAALRLIRPHPSQSPALPNAPLRAPSPRARSLPPRSTHQNNKRKKVFWFFFPKKNKPYAYSAYSAYSACDPCRARTPRICAIA